MSTTNYIATHIKNNDYVQKKTKTKRKTFPAQCRKSLNEVFV